MHDTHPTHLALRVRPSDPRRVFPDPVPAPVRHVRQHRPLLVPADAWGPGRAVHPGHRVLQHHQPGLRHREGPAPGDSHAAGRGRTLLPLPGAAPGDHRVADVQSTRRSRSPGNGDLLQPDLGEPHAHVRQLGGESYHLLADVVQLQKSVHFIAAGPDKVRYPVHRTNRISPESVRLCSPETHVSAGYRRLRSEHGQFAIPGEELQGIEGLYLLQLCSG